MEHKAPFAFLFSFFGDGGSLIVRLWGERKKEAKVRKKMSS